MSIKVKLIALSTIILLTNFGLVKANNSSINKPPYFLHGTGDFATFSLPENFEVGTSVYKLKGVDPEGKRISYSISGPYFSVERESGIVKLIKALDRETVSELETIITITDEPLHPNEEPNTVSLRRLIPIRDFNDNRPTFIGRPYHAKVLETMKIGQALDDVSPILVIDKDEGANADVTLTCYRENNEEADSPCDHFDIVTVRQSEGKYKAELRLVKPVDYEMRKSYILTILARDGSKDHQLKSNATVNINVVDAQDQPPVFFGEPYSVNLNENLPENQLILAINATDGDFGDPNDIILSLERERFGFFKLLKSGKGQAQLLTTGRKIDRENSEILENGGYYTFYVKATEVLRNHTLGDSSFSPVTIMIRDIDDNVVEFNEEFFNLTIPENLATGTALPKLSIIANDRDIGMNSRYNLTLSNIRNANGIFEIFPQTGEGRTQIIVKVRDSTRLDYDVDNEDERTFTFEIIATVNHLPVSRTTVEVHLEGVNDNFPIFDQSNYRFKVAENTEVGAKIDGVAATDQDVGKYGKLNYILRGFGSEHFFTDPRQGGVFVKRNLDYETQKSYSLTLIARDEGGRESNANIFIDIIDLNDNFPQFESNEYYRSIREGSRHFEPQFFVKAFDIDGVSQGNGRISYSIESENSISGHVFTINSETGEMMILSESGVRSSDTFEGTYEIRVRAEDFGRPKLENFTRVVLRVGSENQRPIFQGNLLSSAKTNNIPGPPMVRVQIREDALPGSNVTAIQATDPDGDDELLEFRLMDASDTFVIDERTGLIKLSTFARLDRDTMKNYIVTVNVVDSGAPQAETSTATVKVDILDVNNKPPRFEKTSYTAYVPERAKGAEIIRVRAIDSDESAEVAYSIIEPIRATTKAGLKLTNFDYASIFSINSSTGAITLIENLENKGLYSVTLTVKAKDLNAEKGSQSDICEMFFYIQSHKETGPIFLNEGWNYVDKKINLKIEEEIEVGKSLITLNAEDIATGEKIHTFEMEPHDGFGFFQLQKNEIITRDRIDYEELEQTSFSLMVRAVGSDTFSTADLLIEIINVNDNSPVFDQKLYRVKATENIKSDEIISHVSAHDDDAVRNERDEELGYSKIKYSLEGPNASLFDISTDGDIRLRPNQTLDREKQAFVQLQVVAEDSIGKPLEAHKTSVNVSIEILDVNDVAPKFLNANKDGLILPVIPESSQPSTLIVNLETYDPDEGPSGEVQYEIIDEGDLRGLLTLNHKTGELKNSKLLTGRGRSEPYEVKIRAFDQGNQLPDQRSLFTDQILRIFIGDTFNNDGIPYFMSEDEEANVYENSPIGTKVYKLAAKDPDESTSLSGILRYRIQNDIEDAKFFKIEALSGIITTTQVLDREVKDKYNIIVEVSDQGTPPQASARVLKINVLDVDDEMPLFSRDVQSKAVEMMVLEEQSSGTILGNVSAIDRDVGENGAIDYEIIDGNELGFFQLIIANNNSALLTSTRPIDREKYEKFLLTVKCFPRRERRTNVATRDFYNPEDLSVIQVLVNVVDIDDHLVVFEKPIYIIGIRYSIPLNTHIFTVRAHDVDSSSFPISYLILNVTFTSQFFRRDKRFNEDFSDIFELNNSTGEIIIAKSVSDFVDGFFLLRIRAVNNRFSDAIMKIFIVRDKSILKFVFSRPPMEMTPMLANFSQQIHEQLSNDSDLELITFDAQVLSKPEQIYNFSSTSSCFMLLRHENALPLHEAWKLMNGEEMKNRLRETYIEYSVDAVDSCTFGKDQNAINMAMSSSGKWLVFLSFIVLIASFVSMLAACCIFKKSKYPLRYPMLPPRESNADIYNTNDGQPVLYHQQEPFYSVM